MRQKDSLFLLSQKVKSHSYWGFIHNNWQAYPTHFSENLNHGAKGFPVFLLSQRGEAKFYQGFFPLYLANLSNSFFRESELPLSRDKSIPYVFIVSQSEGPI